MSLVILFFSFYLTFDSLHIPWYQSIHVSLPASGHDTPTSNAPFTSPGDTSRCTNITYPLVASLIPLVASLIPLVASLICNPLLYLFYIHSQYSFFVLVQFINTPNSDIPSIYPHPPFQPSHHPLSLIPSTHRSSPFLGESSTVANASREPFRGSINPNLLTPPCLQPQFSRRLNWHSHLNFI